MRCFQVFTGFACLALFLLLAPAALPAAEKLPQPHRDGGTGLYNLLQERASAPRDAFPTGAVSEAELSTILWAASGRNRDDKGWTVPLAMGKEPYVRIYVLSVKGASLYDWKEHALVEVVRGDIRDQVTSDGFAKAAPYLLLFAADGESIKALGANDRARSFAYTAAGSMSQNIYLAAGDLGVSTRYLATLNHEGAQRGLQLHPDSFAICLLPLGKK